MTMTPEWQVMDVAMHCVAHGLSGTHTTVDADGRPARAIDELPAGGVPGAGRDPADPAVN
jgi:hypothetical protein